MLEGRVGFWEEISLLHSTLTPWPSDQEGRGDDGGRGREDVKENEMEKGRETGKSPFSLIDSLFLHPPSLRSLTLSSKLKS